MTQPSDEMVERVEFAIGRTMDPEDDIDILEALENHFDWITPEQAKRMVNVAARAAIAATGLVEENARLDAAHAEAFRAGQVAMQREAKAVCRGLSGWDDPKAAINQAEEYVQALPIKDKPDE